MKTLFVLTLVLVLLIPTVLSCFVSAEGEVTVKPFYALSWSDFDRDTYPYLEGLYTTAFNTIGDKACMGDVTYGSYTDAEVTAFAQKMKKETDSRPEGTRYWRIHNPSKILKLAPRNVVYLDYGVTQMKDITTAILKKYKEIGGKLDGMVIDTEYTGVDSHYLYANTTKNPNNYQTNKNIYADIVADPEYATRIRPLLEAYGFPFWPNPSGEQSEIYTMCKLNKGEEHTLARAVWDTVIRIHLNNYANEWCYEPLKEYFPEASLSDYQSHDSKSWMKLSAITDDGIALTGGNSIRVGTASSFSYYYARPGQSFFDAMSQYASYNDGLYEASPFNSLLYDVNFTRHMLASTDTKQIAPWIISYLYGSENDCTMARTPYYSELLYHLGMFDPQPFLSNTYVNHYAEDDGTVSLTSTKYLATQQTMNEIMAELTRVAGFSDRKAIEMPQYWNTEFVVSGMYANGRNIWRITPNTDEISLADFKQDGKDPTFSVKGSTVTFPGGKILESATISNVGSCGYWVETAADVTPIITHDADRYEKYPSFQENFDSYNIGTMSADLMNPAAAWEYIVADGSAVNIVSFADGKALSVQGDVILRNTKIPARITAGDSYAKGQIWQLSVTIPEGMSADAVITLLTYTGSGMQLKDGSLRIQGGKLVYSQIASGNNAAIEYKDLCAMPAGTYTIKRIMNMSDPEHFTYSISVLDASGKEIASVKDVPTPNFTTAEAICFSVKGADKTVIFDNYSLTICGLAADFEIYDAASGRYIQGEEMALPREQSTAYRLSWLNATDKEATATVMAAVYENGTLKEKKVIQEVKMQPGYDFVDTGIVEVAQGQSVWVYLQTSFGEQVQIPGDSTDDPSTPTNPTEPTKTKPDDKAPAKKSNTMIMLIAVVVVCVVAVVLTLTLSKPKKKPETPAQETLAQETIEETPTEKKE